MTMPSPVLYAESRRNGKLVRTVAASAFIGVVAAMTLVPARLTAQRSTIPVATTIDSMRADGSIVTVPLRAPTAAFNLFAAEDFACAVYRSTGQLMGGTANVRGPVPLSQGGGCVASHIYGNRSGYILFEMGLAMASPPNEFRKIQAVHPPVGQMLGSLGYNANWQYIVSTPNRTVISAADGEFGTRFSGVRSAFDGSCRDDRDFFQAGFQLMAMKDCAVTWGSEGYRGKLHVPDSVFQNMFEAGENAFTWNEFSIPQSRLDATALLGAQSFYGYMSDYSRDIKQRYGVVVPGGVGNPTESGYPLGIEMRVDGWQFSSPRTRNTQFYQITMVNHSQKLYGTGIDYDSLYFGLTPGFLWNGSHSNSIYYDVGRNTTHVARSGISGKCSNQYPRRYPGQTAGCQGTASGFGAGIYSITWLKSPIGDHRNKLFTDPSSKYFAPDHPLRADTINFNHAIFGAFGNNAFSDGTMRSAFGAMSGIESALLDGRTPAQMGASSYLNFFTPETYSGLPDAANAKLNKFVPGATINPMTGQRFGDWDYNKDGVPDTISVPGCGRQGCHKLWSDTNAGGYRIQYGNVHNSLSTGPFPLAANDTAQFLWAFTYSPDTLEVDLRVNSVINAYLGNWESARPIPFPAVDPVNGFSVQSASLRNDVGATANDALSTARVTIRLPSISPVDSSVLREIARIRDDSLADRGRTRLLLRLNPGLLDRLTVRANDNLAEVFVFKSCDAGTTFTVRNNAAGNCLAAPTQNVGDAPLPFAWQPWKTVRYVKGSPLVFSLTDDVRPARNYLYSMVTRTRGFRDFAIVDSGVGGFTSTDVETMFGIARDTANSSLATTGGTTISVFAPITDVGARQYARIDTATLSGEATQGVLVSNVAATASGTTRLVFGNRFIVRKSIDTVTGSTTTSVIAQNVISSAVLNPSDAPTPDFLARSQPFTVDENIPVRVAAGLLPGTFRVIAGSSRIYVDTITATNAPAYLWIDSNNRPIYLTNQPYSPSFEADQFASPFQPGFTVRPQDSANVMTGFRQQMLASGTLRDRHFILRNPGDTLTAALMDRTTFVQPLSSRTKKNRGGSYTIRWDTDPWGPKAPFTMQSAEQIEQAVGASLDAAAAQMSSVTVLDEAIGTKIGATASRPLVRVRVPFTMTYTDGERGETHPVRFAMLARNAFPFNTRLLGSGVDTMRVTVPDSVWMPGDTLFAIHPVLRDSTVVIKGIRVTVVEPESNNGMESHRPIRVVSDSVGLERLVLSCAPTEAGTRPTLFERATCNPLRAGSPGATEASRYLPVARGWTEYFELAHTLDARSQVALTGLPFMVNSAVSKADLAQVRVVPNPYVVASDMDDFSGGLTRAQLWFTGLPQQGTLRIYSVSGEWIQELTWSAGDLTYQGNATATGDLPYNLKTRAGTDLGSGLYLFVLTTKGTAKEQVHRGKFVVIR